MRRQFSSHRADRFRRLQFQALAERALLAVAAADSLAEGEGEVDPVPDFHLQDVNETSASFEQALSPRDYLQQVSAWYFGHAT